MKVFSVIIKQELHEALNYHLLRSDIQEDLCFATYVSSTGTLRSTAILTEIIYPTNGDRKLHGNVSFTPEYFQRAVQIAATKKEGLVLIHSHLTPGWQDMSEDDIVAEKRIAPAALAACNLPLVGLTMGNDGTWSGRFWLKNSNKARDYERYWCDTVRVIGKKLTISYNDELSPAYCDSDKQLRTISAWGEQTQRDLTRLKIGIAGLGSVGSMVAEILARIGISKFTLIDFDVVENKNLDRLTNVFKIDVGKSKVSVIADAIKRSSTSSNIEVNECEYSICEKKGYLEALDCDVIFSCVDRPWPRQVLNFIAYAHLIPVIDGGILVRSNKTNNKILGADWKAHTIGYKRTCLECLGQYKAENASLEMDGKLDDPNYIKGIDKSQYMESHENVFAFSSHLASMEVLQLLTLFIAPSGVSDIGQQMQHFVLGTLDTDRTKACHKSCYFQSITGKGDMSGVIVYGEHKIAGEARQKRLAPMRNNQ